MDIEEKYNVEDPILGLSPYFSPIDTDVINQWTEKEAAGSSRVSHKMKHHYADVAILPSAFEGNTKFM